MRRGEIGYSEAIDRKPGVVRFMADIGVDGMTILGVLCESNRLVDPERARLIRSNGVRHPGAGLVPSAGEQLHALLSRVPPGVDITKPLAL